MKKEDVLGWVTTVSGNEEPLFFILGLNVIENEAHTLKTAEAIKKIADRLGIKVLFKSSFDKANRSSLTSYRGVSIDQGLKILGKVRTECELPVITDVHEACHVDTVASVVDVLQIPAFLCRQTDLLQNAGKTGKPVHVKKGQFYRPERVDSFIQKIEAVGNKQVWLCERGFTFGYDDLIVDYKNFKIMKTFGKPVVFDVTHAVQKPLGLGTSTGGNRSFVPNLAAAAIIQGIAGIFIEVHENPEQAKCDGPSLIKLSDLERFLKYLIDLDAWAKSRPVPEVL